MVQGALQVQLGKRSEVVRAGELVIFSDEYLVRTQQIGSAQALALCIPSSALYTDAKSINPSIHKAVSFNAGLPAILFGTLKAASKQYPSIDESSQASLDRIVVDLVQTLFTDQIRRAQGVAATDLNYGLALDYISGNLADRSLSINSAAAELGLSRGRLCASFAVHDSSFEQTVIRLRLERAREIIRSHKDVKMSTIADSVGFATAAHFSRSFSQKFGMSPIVYRHGLLNNNVSQPRVPSDVSLI
jgi:AraC-like DNA-binding protein